MIAGVRLTGRLLRITGVIGLGLGMATVLSLSELLRLPVPITRRQRWMRLFMARLSAALPIKVTVVGRRPKGAALWVSNHVSWVDIALLGHLAPLSFLSKAEVRSWPIAGWLAAKAGTLFINRGAGDNQRVRVQMTELLQQGHSVLLFPEGTTTDGQSLRTFHGRLMASAIEAGVALQPVAIRYLRNGKPDLQAPFIGDDDMLSHLLRLLRAPTAEVQIQLLTPIATQGQERALLAFKAQHAVAVALQLDTEPARQPRTAQAA